MKTLGLIVLIAFALIGAFACFGGIRQAVVSRRRTTALERDIQKWEKLNRKYNRHAEKK